MTDPKQFTVVLDVMGADSGEAGIIDGGVEAARSVGDSLHVVLVGRKDLIEQRLSQWDDLPGNISVEHAEGMVPMHVSASEGVRMKDSSIRTGLKLVRDGKADAFISPGNTGAVMGTSYLTLGRIEGVSRPAITGVFPTWTGRPTVVLDVGANADCKPIHLSQFAVMGSVYYSMVFGHEAPRVGLVSIGEERSKGNELIFTALKLLKNTNINFVGNIEGRDILSGTVNVAVTDGFTGNIILKFAESIRPFLVKTMQRQVQTNIFSRIGAMLLTPFLKRMRSSFDYAEAGGAPLLGVNGIVIICHGASGARAIRNAVKLAHNLASRNLLKRIKDELVENHFGRNNDTTIESPDNRNGVVRPAAANDQR